MATLGQSFVKVGRRLLNKASDHTASAST